MPTPRRLKKTTSRRSSTRRGAKVQTLHLPEVQTLHPPEQVIRGRTAGDTPEPEAASPLPSTGSPQQAATVPTTTGLISHGGTHG